MSRPYIIPMAAVVLLLASAKRAQASEATIQSDEMELRNNAEQTIFSGHVVLKQDTYEVHADHMERAKSTEIVDATGHVVGTWISAKGEKVRVEAEQARYNPTTHTVEVWGKHQVTVFVDGEKGKSIFHGDRGWVYTLTPGIAKLSGQVTGHVIPARPL